MKLNVAMAAVAAGIMLAAAGQARAQVTTQPGQVVGWVSPADLEWLVVQGGHTVIGHQTPLHVDADTASGFKFSVVGEACDGEGKAARCQGITFVATWTLEAGVDGKLTTMMDRFNFEFPAAKVMMWDDAIALERYVILTGGVTPENLKTEMEVFLELSDRFWIELDKARGPE